MRVIRKSLVSGKVHEQDLPITEMQVLEYVNGALIQEAFPNLTSAQREFFKSGITEEEWDAIFCDEEADAEEGMGDSDA